MALDQTIKKVKGKKPKYNQAMRLDHIRELSFVDKAVFGDEEDKFRLILKFEPDFICLGYDQEAFTDNLQEKLYEKGLKTKVIRLRPYREDVFKSSKLR